MKENIYAVIDLGSNSFHMAVMQEDHGRIMVVDRIKEMVQLGYGLLDGGGIDPVVRERALHCLRMFRERLVNIAPQNCRAVGTLTLRKMKDPHFIKEAEAALGLPIDIISGREEARLIYLGVSQYVHVENQDLFVMDIGGGSTEFILGHQNSIKSAYSRDVGCVNMTRRFFPDRAFTQQGYEQALIYIESELQSLRYLMPYKDAYFIGTSGTIKTIGTLITYLGFEDEVITREALKRLVRKFIALGSVKKIAKFFDISELRADVIGAGLVILQAAFKILSIKQMSVTNVALREGILFDLLGRVQQKDRRDETINSLITRLGADEGQARRVAISSLKLAKMLKNREGEKITLNEEALRYLKWASYLHEIGLSISHHRHFRHSAYLVEHADLDGFSKQDQRILATIIRNHQRKIDLDDFIGLPEYLLKVTLLLRVSVLFNRGRYLQESPAVEIIVSDKEIELHFEENWLKEHPLFQEDLSSERRFLRQAGIDLTW